MNAIAKMPLKPLRVIKDKLIDTRVIASENVSINTIVKRPKMAIYFTGPYISECFKIWY